MNQSQIGIQRSQMVAGRLFIGSITVTLLIVASGLTIHNGLVTPSIVSPPFEISQAALVSDMSGRLSLSAAVRNSGTEPVSVRGELESFLMPKLSFTRNSIDPGQTAFGASSSAWHVAQFVGLVASARVDNSPSLNYPAFTLEIAFKYESSLPDQQMLVGKGSSGGDSFYLYSFRSANNINDFVIYNNGVRHDHELGDIFLPDQWFAVTIVVDGNSVSAYVNGALAKRWVEAVTFNGNQQDLLIGSCGCGGYYFNGSIAYVRLYDHALPEVEVLSNYSSIVPSTVGLVLWLSFNQTTGGTVSDLSGNGNDAVTAGQVSFPPLVLACSSYLLTVTAVYGNGSKYSISKTVRANC